MKKIIIAFDVDGTLRDNRYEDTVVANERIRTLLITLSSFKNVKIIVWSGGGELYARQMVRALGLDLYVNYIISKNHIGKDLNGKHSFAPEVQPDIAIDDIQDCELGILNLIVKEK